MGRRGFASLYLAVCLVIVGASSAGAQNLTKVRIGLTSSSIPAAVARLTKELGLFEKRGIDATINLMDNGSLATMALLSGSLDFTTTSITDVALAQSQGQDVVALHSIYRGFAGGLVLSKVVADQLGVAPTAPLEARLKALNGLLIASPAATSTYTFTLKLAAESVGANVNFTYMAQPAMVAAMARGLVQGAMVGAPFYSQLEMNGTGVSWVNGPRGQFPKMSVPSHALVLSTKREFAISNPDLVARMRAAFLDFAKATAEQPYEVRAALGKLFPDVDQPTMEKTFEAEANGFKTFELTEADIEQDLAYLKANGVEIKQPDRVTPSNILFK